MTRASRQDAPGGHGTGPAALAVAPPSPWVTRFAPLIDRAAGPVLDVACGRGRHARWLVERGYAVVGVDIDPSGAADLAGRALILRADLERPAATGTRERADNDAPGWPFAEGRFAGVIVTNYLWRPLFDRLIGALAPGGILIYETFAQGNERLGRPATPAHLLAPGELLDRVAGRLGVIAYEHGEVALPRPAVVQRIAAAAPAVRGGDPAAEPPRALPP
ncbi:MAG: class I SAM-dependent methyltransferase [Azospirillaceae bacterium]